MVEIRCSWLAPSRSLFCSYQQVSQSSSFDMPTATIMETSIHTIRKILSLTNHVALFISGIKGNDSDRYRPGGDIWETL